MDQPKPGIPVFNMATGRSEYYIVIFSFPYRVFLFELATPEVPKLQPRVRANKLTVESSSSDEDSSAEGEMDVALCPRPIPAPRKCLLRSYVGISHRETQSLNSQEPNLQPELYIQQVKEESLTLNHLTSGDKTVDVIAAAQPHTPSAAEVQLSYS